MANLRLYITVFTAVASVVSANIHLADEESHVWFANKIEEVLKGVNISSQCDVHFHEYRKGLLRGSTWALQMFDAGVKLPAGLFEGNFADLGSFDECLKIDAKLEESKNIYGQYCLGTVPVDLGSMAMKRKMSLRNLFHPKTDTRMITPDGKMGIQLARCVPHSCSPADVNQIFSYLGLHFYKELCQTKSSQPGLDVGSIGTISFLGVILWFMLMSTAYDALIQYYNKKPHHTILVAFSILTNGKKLITTSDGPNQISCLHGIRVITTMWVILGHRYSIQASFPFRNYLDLFDFMYNPANMFILGATVSVDTFFLMGGLVIAYVYMGTVTKGIKFNILMYYFHRYLRLTPAFAVVILIHMTLLKHLGSGPLWPFVVEQDIASGCEKYWWKALLYIQNYGYQEQFCVGQSWYLSVDMQLFFLSPILLIPLSRWPMVTLAATGFLTACSMVTCFLTGWFFKLNHSIAGNQGEKSEDYMRYYYIATQTRAAPWLIGLIAGYFIFKIKQTNKKLIINKVIIILVWSASLGVLCTCVFAGHDLIFREYDRVVNSIHLAFVRPAWSIAVGSVIYLCVIGYGGPINWFLSLPVFQVTSKFTYTLYLAHFIVIYLTTGQMRDTPRFSSGKMMYVFWGDFIFTMVVAVMLTLAFESPMITIEKVLFGGTKKTTVRPPPHDEYKTKIIPIEEA